MLVVVIDRHYLGDGRINRHLDYISKIYPTIRINFSPSNNGIRECLLSNNISCYCQPVSSSSSANHNTFAQYLVFAGYVPKGVKSFVLSHLESTQDIILHVHDPALLTISVHLKKWLFKIGKNVRLVYDRHEFYEKYEIKHWYPTPTNHTFEKVFGSFVDGVIGISHETEVSLKYLFSHACIASVPNYIDFQKIDGASTLEKINSILSGGVLRCVYFGTLNMASREIDLISWLSDNLLTNYSNVEVVIGGNTNDGALLSTFSSLSLKHPNRFKYLGYVPYEQLIEETQKAAIGFLFIRETGGSYWVSDGSPNKLYEYLNCGVIPVMRIPHIDIEYLKPEVVLCNSNESWDEILVRVQSLIESPRNILKTHIESLLEKSVPYRFSHVAPNYLRIYQQVFEKKKVN